jgi:hypothetical protein
MENFLKATPEGVALDTGFLLGFAVELWLLPEGISSCDTT